MPVPPFYACLLAAPFAGVVPMLLADELKSVLWMPAIAHHLKDWSTYREKIELQQYTNETLRRGTAERAHS